MFGSVDEVETTTNYAEPMISTILSSLRGSPLGEALLVLVCLAATGCSKPATTYAYRLTLEVQTPEGLRKGESTIQIKTSVTTPPMPYAGMASHDVAGEAVVVDLGIRGKLFALFRQGDKGGFTSEYDWSPDLLSQLAPKIEPAEGESAHETQARALASLPGVHTLWPRQKNRPARQTLPLLVRFDNLRNPWTVRQVSYDNLASSFGPGVHLRRMTAEVVQADPVFRLRAVLPWLRDRADAFIVGPDKTRANPTFPESLRVRDFVHD